MKTLHLSKDLKLPLDAVTQTFAILAMRGVGKTHTASVFAEEMSEAGLPFVVLDPTGAWWGLRAGADGKSPGYPVTILGGDHGDVPLEEGGGKLIADLVAEKAPSLILDLSLLSKSAMRRFVADFAEELYRKNRQPLHLIIDEADSFAPQRPRPDEMRMLGALDEIVRRGRIRGLGCTLVTQRSAVLNKDVLTQTEALVVLRTAHPRDRAPVLEWMKVHATPEQLGQVEESLAKLPKGDAWVMSAGWLDLFARVHIRERRTFNSSATPAPGQVRAAPRQLAPVDLKELQARMAETIERAKASDPAALRRRVSELERELARKPVPLLPPQVKAEPARRVEVPVLREVDVARVERMLDTLLKGQDRIAQAAENLRAMVAERSKAIVARHPTPPPAAPRPAAPAPLQRRPAPALAAARAASPRQATEGAPGKGELRILAAIAQHAEGVTREQLTVLTGYKRSSRDTYLQRLGAACLVGSLSDGRIRVTPAGLEALGPNFEPLPTGPALLAHWRGRLPAGELAVLEVAVKAYPGAVEKERISEATGYQRSSRDTYLQRLRSRRLVEVHRGEVRAAAELF